MEPVIQIVEVSKTYDLGEIKIEALRHVSFEVDGTNYAATVVLKGDDKLQPITSATGLQVTR